MADNPALLPNRFPAPFPDEYVLLERQGMELSLRSPSSGQRCSGKGRVYLSDVRMVFVFDGGPVKAPNGGQALEAFDIPLLYIGSERFNQPIFGCNNVSGTVRRVVSSQPQAADYYDFQLYFLQGGVGTFLPIFYNVLELVRIEGSGQMAMAAAQQVGASRLQWILLLSDGGSGHIEMTSAVIYARV